MVQTVLCTQNLTRCSFSNELQALQYSINRCFIDKFFLDCLITTVLSRMHFDEYLIKQLASYVKKEKGYKRGTEDTKGTVKLINLK